MRQIFVEITHLIRPRSEAINNNSKGADLNYQPCQNITRGDPRERGLKKSSSDDQDIRNTERLTLSSDDDDDYEGRARIIIIHEEMDSAAATEAVDEIGFCQVQ